MSRVSAAPSGIRSIVAPSGTLRAVINLGNPVLAQGTPQTPSGVTVAIAERLATWLGVPLELVCVDAARKAYAAITEGRVDVCFLADEPEREAGVRFTAPYVVIEGVYVAGQDSRFRSSADVDSEGTRVAVREGSAYDLFLGRALNRASVVRADEAIEVYEAQGLDVVAGVRQPMERYAAATGQRLLEPAFMQIHQAVGLPRNGDVTGWVAVSAQIELLKSSGFISDALATSGQHAAVAPEAERAGSTDRPNP